MNKLTKNIKKTYALYSHSREQGLSVTSALLLIAYRITILFFRGRNIPEKIIQLDLFDIAPTSPSNKATLSAKPASQQKLFIWVIPRTDNIWSGGHYTLFRFIIFFAKKHQVKNIIYVYDEFNGPQAINAFQEKLNTTFNTTHFHLTGEINQLPMGDAVIATTWISAYFARKIAAKEKFYFMQDYESLFYHAGTQALQANYTYQFGFHGITGGLWLKSIYESYGNQAQHYIFSADRDIFYPADPENLIRDEVKRIFFYGRPSTPRRAYELGMVALAMVAREYPHIEIVIAGLSGLSRPGFRCTLLGNLSLKETGDLYRTCDIGIALSATNMSYLPVELMASGCPVISNDGPQVEWFCKDQYNCLLTSPVPSDIFRAVKQLVESKALRQELAQNGLKTIQTTTWEQEMEKVYQYISHNLQATTVDKGCNITPHNILTNPGELQ